MRNEKTESENEKRSHCRWGTTPKIEQRDHVPLVTVKRTSIDQRTRKWEKKRVSNRIAQDKEKKGKLLEPSHGSLALDARAKRHFSKFDMWRNFQKW